MSRAWHSGVKATPQVPTLALTQTLTLTLTTPDDGAPSVSVQFSVSCACTVAGSRFFVSTITYGAVLWFTARISRYRVMVSCTCVRTGKGIDKNIAPWSPMMGAPSEVSHRQRLMVCHDISVLGLIVDHAQHMVSFAAHELEH